MNKKGSEAFWFLVKIMIAVIVLIIIIGGVYSMYRKGINPLTAFIDFTAEGFKGAKDLFLGGGLGDIFGKEKDEFTDKEVRQTVEGKCAKELEEIDPEGEDENLLEIFKGEEELCIELILCAEKLKDEEEYEDSIYNLGTLLTYCKGDSRTSEEAVYLLLLNESFDKVEEAHRIRDNFGEFYFNNAMYEKARGMFEKVAKFDGGLATEAQYKVGETYYKERNYEKAKEAYGKVEELEKAKEKISELDPTGYIDSYDLVTFEELPSVINIYKYQRYFLRVRIHDRTFGMMKFVRLTIFDENKKPVFEGIDDYSMVIPPEIVDFLWYENLEFISEYKRKRETIREKEWFKKPGDDLEPGNYYYELSAVKEVVVEKEKKQITRKKTGMFKLIKELGELKVEIPRSEERRVVRIFNYIRDSYRTCRLSGGSDCVCEYDGSYVEGEFKELSDNLRSEEASNDFSIQFINISSRGGTMMRLVYGGEAIREEFLEDVSPCYHDFTFVYEPKEIELMELKYIRREVDLLIGKVISETLYLFDEYEVAESAGGIIVLYKTADEQICFAPTKLASGDNIKKCTGTFVPI